MLRERVTYMRLLLRYHLTTGKAIDHVTNDFATVVDACNTCARMLGGQRSVATLNGPSGSRAVNADHIVYVEISEIAPKEGTT